MASPISATMKRSIRVAVSSVVEANEMTSTAIKVAARIGEKPSSARNAAPPSTNAAALLPDAWAQLS